MGPDTECDQRLASVPLSQSGLHASFALATTLRILKTIRSWILVALQRAQVANETGKVLGAHLIRIRRHRVRRHNFKFAKIRLLKRLELVVTVHHLNGETIVPQKSSRNCLSIACYELDAPILRTNFFLRRY